MAVDYWAGDSWSEFDRVDINQDRSFYKTLKEKSGQIRLRLWGEPTHWIDFVLTQQKAPDLLLDFGTVDYYYFDGNPADLQGSEHKAYFALLTDHKKYRLLRDSLANTKTLSKEAKAELENQVERSKLLSNNRCKEVMLSNKGNFTGDIVANLLYVPVPSDYASIEKSKSLSIPDFERAYLLDKLPLGDSRVLLHNGLIRALNQYTTKFLDADSSEYVKRVLSRLKSNESVNSWMFKYLFQVSLNYKNDNAISYLVKWYDNKNLHGPIEVDRFTENLIFAFRNCEVGKKAFNLTLPDAAGKQIRLADIASKSKLTLLVFWRTDCSHCLEFEKELEVFYKKYKPLGLEVIGICMDPAETSWRNYITSNPIPWTSVFPINRELRIQTVANFPIAGTPSVVAVDSAFKVKNRMVIRANIEDYLKDELQD